MIEAKAPRGAAPSKRCSAACAEKRHATLRTNLSRCRAVKMPWPVREEQRRRTVSQCPRPQAGPCGCNPNWQPTEHHPTCPTKMQGSIYFDNNADQEHHQMRRCGLWHQPTQVHAYISHICRGQKTGRSPSTGKPTHQDPSQEHRQWAALCKATRAANSTIDTIPREDPPVVSIKGFHKGL